MDLVVFAQEAAETADLPQWVYVATAIAVVVGLIVVVANITISRRQESVARKAAANDADPLG